MTAILWFELVGAGLVLTSYISLVFVSCVIELTRFANGSLTFGALRTIVKRAAMTEVETSTSGIGSHLTFLGNVMSERMQT